MGTVLAQRRKNEGLILHQIGATPLLAFIALYLTLGEKGSILTDLPSIPTLGTSPGSFPAALRALWASEVNAHQSRRLIKSSTIKWNQTLASFS